MTIRTKAVLKSYYNTGDTPSEANFADWIDMVPPEPFALYVAASDAEAREIASADYVCDGTDDDIQFLYIAGFYLTEQIIQRHLCSLGQCIFPQSHLVFFSGGFSPVDIVQTVKSVPRLGDVV